MNEPKWLTRGMALAIHAEALAQFGGSPGLRDAGLLESALARPARIFAYRTGPTLFDLAAALTGTSARRSSAPGPFFS